MGLDTVEIVFACEKAFQVEITDGDALQIRTVGDLNDCVARKVAERASWGGRPTAPEPELTWPRVVAIVAGESGVPAEHIRPESRWRQDLGID